MGRCDTVGWRMEPSKRYEEGSEVEADGEAGVLMNKTSLYVLDARLSIASSLTRPSRQMIKTLIKVAVSPPSSRT